MKQKEHGKEHKRKGINEKDNARWKRFSLLKMQKEFGEAFNQQYIKERNSIIVDYIYIAKKLSDLMHMKHPDFDKDDLYGWGCCGLMDAIERYDVAKGIQFETFSTYRVFGAMYDEMRKIDWTPRLARKRAAIIEKLSLKYFSESGRNPTDEEILEMMEGEEAIGGRRALKDKRTAMMVSMTYASDEDQDWMQSLAEDSTDIKQCESNDSIEYICNKFLDEPESKMLKCIFEHNMTLKEAAKHMRIKNERKAASIYKSMMLKLRDPEVSLSVKRMLQKFY